MHENALIIIAKYPEKESVKTRLKGLMPDEKRVGLYVSLLNHTVEKLRSVSGVDTFVAYAPAHAQEYFSRFGTGLIPLPDGDLGGRMSHAFEEVFHSGYRKAALVGTDIPDLTVSIIRNAFDFLSDSDIIYGPAKDGGYYLVGMRKLIREIFEGVPWSSEQTLKKSVEQAKKYGYSVSFTETLSDIDTIEDVEGTGLRL